jgi:hypothetical protein
MLQSPLRDLVLAREPNVIVAFRVGQETIQYPNPVCMSVDPVMHSDQHQSTAARSFFI